jgi:hypothetical protein
MLAVFHGLLMAGGVDHTMLSRALHIDDGLYASLRFAGGEPHNWPPKA